MWLSANSTQMSSCGRVQSQRPMSSSEEQGSPAGPTQEPSDRWLGAKGPGHIGVAVQYNVKGNGDISSKWDVDASKALPSKLPMFMYRYVSSTLQALPCIKINSNMWHAFNNHQYQESQQQQ